MSKLCYDFEICEEDPEMVSYSAPAFSYTIIRHGDDCESSIVDDGSSSTRSGCINKVLAYLKSVGADIN